MPSNERPFPGGSQMTEPEAIAAATAAFDDYTWRCAYAAHEGWIVFDDGLGNLAYVTDNDVELFEASRRRPPEDPASPFAAPASPLAWGTHFESLGKDRDEDEEMGAELL
jgi:hypothetical protein